MKTYRYDLDIQEIREVGGGPVMAYQSKGHHDLGAFAEYAGVSYMLTIPDPEKAVHTYQRVVPSADGDGMMLVNCAGPARGAYPVTYIDMQYVRDAEI